jgi:hypothetical protein
VDCPSREALGPWDGDGPADVLEGAVGGTEGGRGGYDR